MEEPWFLVANKPAGLFTQAADGIQSVQTLLQSQLADAGENLESQPPKNPFVGLPHRLDRVTSGALLIARNQRALRRFNDQFQSRKTGKFYLALVTGEVARYFEHPGGLLDCEDYVTKIPDQAKAMVVEKDRAEGRKAELAARLVAESDGIAVLLIHLKTGRMHQIRIQLAERAMPVLNDELYGGADYHAWQSTQEVSEDAMPDRDAARVGLHALRLEFRHPKSGVAISATASLPDHFRKLPSSVVASMEELAEQSRSTQASNWQLATL